MAEVMRLLLPAGAGQTVCVTGAGGFIASWIVKLLLDRGYTVKGTVRNPDPKNSHLSELPGAKERLILCKADILDCESLKEAIFGCDGVFHTACPITNNADEIMEPAVNGTRNVIMVAAAEVKCRRVVFTSSIGAVYMDPNRDPNTVVDESCWSDPDYCKKTKNWYCYGKMVAEQTAWEVAREKGVDLVVVNPCVVIGPFLQPTINATNGHILKYLSSSTNTYPNSVQAYVHVCDAAMAHILVYQNPSSSGRYLCAGTILHRADLVMILANLYPAQYPLPTKCSDEVNPRAKPYKLSNRKLKKLGMEFIPVKQCLYDTVKSLQEKGYVIPLILQQQDKSLWIPSKY